MQLFKHQRYDAANGAAFYEMSAKLASKQSWLRYLLSFAANTNTNTNTNANTNDATFL